MAVNLKEVRDRISSVNNTQQITKAMKMVSAAKLRRAQDAIVRMRPYANKLDEMLRNILSNLGGNAQTSFGEVREVKKACVVVVTSNRGLCGAFNTNIIKSAVATIEEKYADLKGTKKLTIVCIGKKGYEYFTKYYKGCCIINDYVHLFDNLTHEKIASPAKFIMKAFGRGQFDEVVVSYGKFKNAGTQITTTENFLPVTQLEVDGESDDSTYKADYSFEPSKEELLDYLIPSILQTTFQKFVLDTHASEHGARMTAMEKATENANDLLKELKLSYNKARQEAITNEILEIVGGAAALGG